MTARYNRRVTLTIGPFKEAQQTEEAAQGEPYVAISSGGDFNDFRVKFVVKKSLLGTPLNTSIIEMYNLSADTTNRIALGYTAVALDIGYGSGDSFENLGTVMRGSISAMYSYRDGGDIVTRLITYDGLNGTSIGFIRLNYSSIQKVSDVLNAVVSKLQGISVGTINVTAETGGKGLVLVGNAAHIIHSLANQYGFSASINNGIFNAYDDDKQSGEVFDISANAGNLLHVSPLLESANTIQTGILIQALLDPRMLPGDNVKLTSVISPQLNSDAIQNNAALLPSTNKPQKNGNYKIINISHRGDTHGNDWVSEIESLNQFLARIGINPSSTEATQ